MKSFFRGGHQQLHPAVYIVSAINALTLFGDSLLYAVLPLYGPELGIPLGAIGILLSMNRWIRLATNPLAAAVFRRRGLIGPLSVVTAASAAATFTYAQGWGLTLFAAARALWGLCWSHLRLGSFLILLGTSRHQLGLALGANHAITRLGSASTALIGGALIDRLGYRPGFTIMAAGTLAALFLLVPLARSLPHNRVGLDEDRPSSAAARALEPAADRGHPAEFSQNFCFAGGFAASFVGSGILMSTLSLVLQSRMGSSITIVGFSLGAATVTGALFAVRWLSNLLVAPLAGRAADHFGRRSVLGLLIASTALLIVLLAARPTFAATVVFASLAFFAHNGLEVVLEAAVGDTTAAADSARAVSVFASFHDFGAATGPLAAYALISVFQPAAPLYLAGFCLVLLLGAFNRSSATAA